MDESLYYNPQKMLSYNRLLNFVIGARSTGKSFAMKKYPIDRFINHGEQFIYLRRYKDEIKENIDTYFQDIEEFYPEHIFSVKGKKLYCNGSLMGYAIPLSSWQSKKSASYHHVTTIVYDEFIREKDNSGYIPNEPKALLNFVHTVRRQRPNFRCICLSNAVSVVNPYFLFFNLKLRKDPETNDYYRYNTFKHNKQILVEIPPSKEFMEALQNDPFYELTQGTEYHEMAFNNEFTADDSTFIQKRGSKSKYKFSVHYDGRIFGYWLDLSEGLLYASFSHDPSSKRVWAMTTSEMKENVYLMNNWRDCYDLKELVKALKQGYLRYENQTIKNLHYDMFKKMNIQ